MFLGYTECDLGIVPAESYVSARQIRELSQNGFLKNIDHVTFTCGDLNCKDNHHIEKTPALHAANISGSSEDISQAPNFRTERHVSHSPGCFLQRTTPKDLYDLVKISRHDVGKVFYKTPLETRSFVPITEQSNLLETGYKDFYKKQYNEEDQNERIIRDQRFKTWLTTMTHNVRDIVGEIVNLSNHAFFNKEFTIYQDASSVNGTPITASDLMRNWSDRNTLERPGIIYGCILAMYRDKDKIKIKFGPDKYRVTAPELFDNHDGITITINGEVWDDAISNGFFVHIREEISQYTDHGALETVGFIYNDLPSDAQNPKELIVDNMESLSYISFLPRRKVASTPLRL